jgi:phosphoglycolate phosphatase
MKGYPYDLILFDLDGTLIETAPEIADAVNDTLAAFDREPVTQQQVNDWIGHGTRELLIQAMAHVDGVDAQTVRHSEAFATIEAAFGLHYELRCGTRSQLYPGVRLMLEALRAAGVKLAVVTNKEERYTRVVLDAHQLLPLFHRVISGDTLAVKKPHPAAVDDCLMRFSVARDRALFVGDSSIDVATARNAGIAVWALTYGYNMGQPIEDSRPNRVISDFSALAALLPARVAADD